MDAVVRFDGKPESVLAGVRERVRALDRELPVANVRTMDEWVRQSGAPPRLGAGLLALFAGVALFTAAVGTYSVLAYSVSERTGEIGLRLALGAEPGVIVRLVVREGMALGLLGIGAGLFGALALSRVLASLAFGVTERDPATFAVVAIGVAAIALLACTLPARWASRVDPNTALRHD
jgi:putative ABC transport system permease protein